MLQLLEGFSNHSLQQWQFS